MVVEEKSEKEYNVDSIVDSYNKELHRVRSYNGAEEIPLSIIDPMKEKIEENFTLVREDLHHTLGSLEARVMHQYKQYLDCKRLADSEKKNLEDVYNIRTSFDSLALLEKKKARLEHDFQQEHNRLQNLYQSKQTELSQHLTAERKVFEDEMFKKRASWESEILDYETLIESRRLEFDKIEASLKCEIDEKRHQWLKEETLLVADYEKRRLKIDQDFAAFESELESKSKDLEKRELEFRGLMIAKEKEWVSTLSEIEARKNHLVEDVQALEVQIQISRDIEETELSRRRDTLESELKNRKIAFEKELHVLRNEMLVSYKSERDSDVDAVYSIEKAAYEKDLLFLKSRLATVCGDLEKSQLEYKNRGESKDKEIVSLKGQLDRASKRLDAEVNEVRLSVSEKLSRESALLIETIKKEFNVQFDVQKNDYLALEFLLKSEKETVTELEAQLKRAESSLNQIVVNSIENSSKSYAQFTGKPDRLKPKILRTSKHFGDRFL